MSFLDRQVIDGSVFKYPTTWYQASGLFTAKAVSEAADRYTLLSPAEIRVDVGGKSLTQYSGQTLDLSVAANWDAVTPTDYTTGSNRAGKDFYVYACWPTIGHTPKLVLSANSTIPAGYTSTNSRKLGGFPCVCVNYGTISGHPLSGYVAGDIIPNGVWCLKNRCETQSNEGLAYDNEIGAWGYIYLASQITAGVPGSVFNGTIWSNISWLNAVDAALAAKMRFPWDAEYQSMAALSNEGTSIAGGVDPTVTGGHSDTATRRMVSRFGFEDMCGCKDHWLQDQSFQYDNSTWGNLVLPGNRGSIYRQGTYGDVKMVAGGVYNAGVNAGSRGRNLSYARQSFAATLGFRLIARNQVR